MSQPPAKRSPDADHESEGADQASEERDLTSPAHERLLAAQINDLEPMIRHLALVISVLEPVIRPLIEWISDLAPVI